MTAEATPDLDTVFVRSERIVGRRIADEYILVPIVGRGAEVDSIFNLNRVATFIWEKLDGSRSGRQIVEALLERFDVGLARAEQDYREFVAKLLSIAAVSARDSAR